MSIPALQPEREPTRLLSVRITEFEQLVVRALAMKEQLGPVRPEGGNVSAMVQIGLAFALRYMPEGWRPENGKILPDAETVRELIDAPAGAEFGSYTRAIDGVAGYISQVLLAEGRGDEIEAAANRFPA